MTVYDWAVSLWRTAVPYIVGFLAVQLARLGVDIDHASAAGALVVGFGIVYYAVFRRLEQVAGSGWGWLLAAGCWVWHGRRSTRLVVLRIRRVAGTEHWPPPPWADGRPGPIPF